MTTTTRTPERVHAKKLYLWESTPGISGFKRWGEVERRIVTGLRARALPRSEIRGPVYLDIAARYRFEDGHLPEFQPVHDGFLAASFLIDNPYAAVVPMEVKP